MARLAPEFLDEIKHRLPCSSVVGQRVRLKKAGREWVGLSPFNAEKTPSFYVNDQKQAWFDFSSGRNGNIFDFLMQTDGVTFPVAVEILARDAGLPMPAGWGKRDWTPDPAHEARMAAQRAESERRQAAQAREDQDSVASRRRIAHAIWTQARPVEGTLGASYLELRGIGFAAGFRSLRFHPALEHYGCGGERSCWPGIVAAVRAPDDGRFLAVWRILLSPDHPDLKAPKEIVGKKGKLGRGSFQRYGGSVWLGGQPGETAHVCEGIETGCAIHGILGQKEPVQSALSSGGMVAFKPPAGCKRVKIWPDGDTDRIGTDPRTGEERWVESPGIAAAKALKDRLISEGIAATINPIPKNGSDWADIWLRGRKLVNAGW